MAVKKIFGGCVKSILPPTAAKENFLKLFEKHSAAFGGRIKFFKTLILFILRIKMNKISVLKKYFLAAPGAKEQPQEIPS